MDLEKKYLEQRQWFIDRIGKKVYRCDLKCACEVCQSGKKGILIEDYDQACYMNDCKGEMGINYYDSIEELENDIDNRAENYVNKVNIDPKTYIGDVITAYVIGASDLDEIKNREINSLKEVNEALFVQVETLIKQKDEIETKYYAYKRKHPEYFSGGICESCGSNIRNCIC